MKWQLAVAKPFDSGWDLTPLYEEPATVSPTEWHQLQVWRSGDQIWVGVDGEVSANLRDNRFAFGQIIVWVEIGDLPPPLVRPVRLTRWWCASLSADIDANEPFPARLGEWKTKADGWTLQTSTGQPFALSLLGAPDLPAWWVADILWRNETFGLVFGWLDENHYHLLRLRPYEKTAKPHRAVLELVAIRQSRETILDKWDLLLESGKGLSVGFADDGKSSERLHQRHGFGEGGNFACRQSRVVDKFVAELEAVLALHRRRTAAVLDSRNGRNSSTPYWQPHHRPRSGFHYPPRRSSAQRPFERQIESRASHLAR
jgi:hypothetical protein